MDQLLFGYISDNFAEFILARKCGVPGIGGLILIQTTTLADLLREYGYEEEVEPPEHVPLEGAIGALRKMTAGLMVNIGALYIER